MFPDAPPPFPGLQPAAFAFLRDLKANNDRAWFQPRKAVYEHELRDPLECLVADLAARLPDAGVPLTGDPRRALFRIYRDTRFSKNKDPYKTHVGMYLTRSGDKNEDGGLYLHVAPGETFVGGGFWSPDPRLLRRWREDMAAAPERFLGVAAVLEASGLTLERQDPLTRMPRGFEALAGAPIAPFLQARGLYATRRFPDEATFSPAFTDEAVAVAQALMPLLEWGWRLADNLGAVPGR